MQGIEPKPQFAERLLQLKPGCSVAFCEGGAVLLDQTSGQYVQLDGSTVASLASVLGSHPLQPPDMAVEGTRPLRTAGYLVSRTATQGTPAQTGERAARELPGPRVEDATNYGKHALRVWGSIIRAKALLSTGALAKSIDYLERLRCKSAAQPKPTERDAILLLETFRRYQPFLYSTKDRCTLNSLSLLLYLAENGVFPSWWFGVKLRPFEAHCWVEDESWVYNDQFANIYTFTPILRV